jgi:hypothetical protein
MRQVQLQIESETTVAATREEQTHRPRRHPVVQLRHVFIHHPMEDHPEEARHGETHRRARHPVVRM